MNQLKELLARIISGEELIYLVLSNLKRKDTIGFNKVDIKPVLIKNRLLYQFTYNYDKKVIHENLDNNETKAKIIELLEENFRQGMIFTKKMDYQVLISKKGKVRILEKEASKKEVDLSHNRSKEYILKEGEAIDFLVRLGVMTKEGKVVAKRYDKFKQINRFLEMVSDVIGRVEKEKTINIVDFGCGKSYLTFALYHYLVNILDLNINIIGLDLKKDVIEFCNLVAEDLDYKQLKFIHGDINDFQEMDKVHMVVTLHACDTATDSALVKAINWDAQVILSVPCCQHEFYDKVENPVLQPMLKHGIIREKLSSLVTDSLRANVLEILGYEVQLLEFIDMEHTPKNILIRAVNTSNAYRKDHIESYIEYKKFWNLNDIYIENQLGAEFQKNVSGGKYE